jgi:nicotinamidase-related amidase
VKALIVVDVQNGVYQWEGSEVFAGQRTVATINELIARCRAAGNPVIFVQHEDQCLSPGSAPWELLSALDIRGDDARVSKQHGSAFQETLLDESLRAEGIGRVVVCGMQTELCVDSTCRHAIALGYDVELAADAHTTFDTAVLTASQIVDHHNSTLRNYCDVRPADSIVFESRGARAAKPLE